MMKGMIYTMVIVSVCVSVYSAGCHVERRYPLYKQCDHKWRCQPLGVSTTICKGGAIVCSIASAIAGSGRTIKNQPVNPYLINEYLMSNNLYYKDYFDYSSVSEFGLVFRGQYSDIKTIKDGICSNKVVILSVNKGRNFVLASGFLDGIFYVNDPQYTKNSYREEEIVFGLIYDLTIVTIKVPISFN